MTLDLYTLHETPQSGEFIIQKFDTDYTCQSVYACSLTTCMCPQGHKDRCRHRTMLPMFLKHGHIGDGWFLEWNTRMWRRPINDITSTPSIADETVMGTSAGPGTLPSPGPGAEAAPAPSAPSPPEGPQPSLSAEVPEPARPVGVGIVKRRKIP